MANVISNLPMPALNGPGAAVDVSAMGRDKTVVITGDFQGATITVEVSEEAGGAGAYAPVYTFQSGDRKRVIAVAARYMRVNVANRKTSVPFSATADAAADDMGATFAVLTLPAGNGAGTSVNCSTLGEFKTFVVGGSFPGARILIEVSDDGATWAPVTMFTAYGGQASLVVTGTFFRTNVSGRSSVPFSATVAIGAIVDPTVPAPQVPIPGGSTCYIYQPGGAQTGPGTFDTWADLMAALAVARAQSNGSGCYTIQFDDSLSSPASIPAGGPYDMTDVTWEGTLKATLVSIDDGATFTKLRMFKGPLAVINNNMITPACADVANGEIVTLRQTSLSTADGSVAFYSGAALAGGQALLVQAYDGSSIGQYDIGPVFNFPTANTTLSFAFTADSYIATALAFVGAATTTLALLADSLQSVPTIWPNWVGTVDPSASPAVPPSLFPRPYLTAPATTAFGGSFGQWLRFDASGAPIAETLPSINAAPNGISGPGCFLLISESGGGVLTIAPDVGDTLQGGAGAVTVPANGAALLVSDGASNWTIISSFTSGGVNAGDSTCLVFQPGGVKSGPGTFSTWATLVARLAALRASANGGGCYTIQFDDSLSSPATIPAGGPYDMTGVTWEGRAAVTAAVSVADGASFTGLRSFGGNIQIVNHNTVAAACTDLASGDIITMHSATIETVAGGKAMYDATAAGAGASIIVLLYESSQLGVTQTGPVFNFPLGGGSTLFVGKEGISAIGVAGCLVGVAGAVLTIATSSLQSVQATFANWAGTVTTPRLDVPPSLVPTPYLTAPSAASTVATSASQWLRKNAAGGAFSQALPKISTATGALTGPGCFVLVSESGGGVLTITAAAGDTIQGGASINIPASGAMLFISDGVSNWTVVGKFGNNRFSPPEKWNQQAVAASQTNVGLSTLVSTNFDDIKMIRAGSIVGLGTRFSTAVSAGTATVKVSVNGATTGTLNVVSTNASNASGGQSTQQAGIDRFVAGDEISVLITTSGAFAPAAGTNIEAWLEIEEVP